MLDWVAAGGLVAGALAGFAASYGRLCTMTAIENALVGGDLRGVKAWGVAIATAVVSTQVLVFLGLVDLSSAVYSSPRLHLAGTVLGGLSFGLGMTLVGTCSFGLLVRAGRGDLRAAVSAAVIGIFAMASTAGALGHVRARFLAFGQIDLSGRGGTHLVRWLDHAVGTGGWAVATLIVLALLAAALADRRLRHRPRLLIGSVAMGLAVAVGWLASSKAVDLLVLDRPESLSFVAPVGRALLQFMMEPFRNVGFGVAAMTGVLVASAGVAIVRSEFRWEAFDDSTEMRRHLLGGAFMGIGGVLAQGCTIGQGLSAASVLSISAPIFIACVVLGAKIGLVHLLKVD